MSSDIIPIGNQVAHPAKFEDPIRVAFSPAKPTTDALTKLRPARNWLADWQKRDGRQSCMLNLEKYHPCQLVDEAKSRLAIVPDTTVLEEARQLFRDAEHVAAPAGWYMLALNAMLAGAPNTKSVAPAYAFAIVDSILYDEEIQDGYGPGFSCPVVVGALRELRREMEFIPTAADVLQACRLHRRQFVEHQHIADVLIEVRRNAEEVIADDAAETERQRRWESGWRPKGWRKEDEDMDIPF